MLISFLISCFIVQFFNFCVNFYACGWLYFLIIRCMKTYVLKDSTPDLIALNEAIIKNSITPANFNDIDELIEKIGEAKYVLLGEASHGTHEYYTWRMAISQRLIKEKNF